MTKTENGEMGPSGPRGSGNRRDDKRARRRLMVRYGAGSADKMAFTKNISISGMFVQTNSVFRPGTTLHVRIEFPDQAFTMWAEVVWAKKVPAQLAHVLGCGMGLRFVNPPPGWAEAYDRWASSQGL